MGESNNKIKKLVFRYLILVSALVFVIHVVHKQYFDFFDKISFTVAIILFLPILPLVFSILSKKNISNVDKGSIEFRINNGKSISVFLLSVLRSHWVELFTLFIIIICLFASFIEEKISDKDYVSLLVGFALSIFSVLFGVLGMYFAYLAEEKSDKLLKDKASIFEGFFDFMRKVNFTFDYFFNDVEYNYRNRLEQDKLPLKSPLIKKNEARNKFNELYIFKFMFLTPFLGHAGFLTRKFQEHYPDTKFDAGVFSDLLKQHVLFMNNLLKLKAFTNCAIQFIIPPLNQVVEWYLTIQLIEIFKMKFGGNGKKGSNLKKSLTDQEKTDIKNQLIEYLNFMKGEEKIEVIGKEKIRSFTSLVKLYERAFNKCNNNRIINFFRISHRENIPFQGAIITKYYRNDNPNQFKNLSYTNPEILDNEHALSATISMVNIGTFSNVLKNMANQNYDGFQYGLGGLFKELHSAYHTDDPRMARILNSHFNQTWNTKAEDHYPSYYYDSDINEYKKEEIEYVSNLWNEDVVDKILTKYSTSELK